MKLLIHDYNETMKRLLHARVGQMTLLYTALHTPANLSKRCMYSISQNYQIINMKIILHRGHCHASFVFNNKTKMIEDYPSPWDLCRRTKCLISCQPI